MNGPEGAGLGDWNCKGKLQSQRDCTQANNEAAKTRGYMQDCKPRPESSNEVMLMKKYSECRSQFTNRGQFTNSSVFN